MLLAADQGAIITVNGGETWSSPGTTSRPRSSTTSAPTTRSRTGSTAGSRRAARSASPAAATTARSPSATGTRSASRSTATSPPTRSNPNIVYGGKISRFDRRTGQVQNIAPEALRAGKYRFLRTAPVLFSPVDPRALYFAGERSVEDDRRRAELGR